MKSWMWPWAAVYAAQVVVAMFVFNIVGDHVGAGWRAGVVAAAIFSVPMIALWRAKAAFRCGRTRGRLIRSDHGGYVKRVGL